MLGIVGRLVKLRRHVRGGHARAHARQTGRVLRQPDSPPELQPGLLLVLGLVDLVDGVHGVVRWRLAPPLPRLGERLRWHPEP